MELNKSRDGIGTQLYRLGALVECLGIPPYARIPLIGKT